MIKLITFCNAILLVALSFSFSYEQNEIQQKVTTQFSFQSSVYSPTGLSDMSSGSPTVVDFTCDEGATGLADQAAINSDQVDLGVPSYTFYGCCNS